MERSEIFNTLKNILIKGMDDVNGIISGCNENSNLRTDLNLNSIGMLYLVISIEEAFDMRFDNVSFNDFTTVGDVIDYIEKQR